MGQSTSALQKLYESYQGKLDGVVGGDDNEYDKSGGCFCVSGSYEYSFVSAAKRKMIRDIAQIFHDQFGLVKNPKNLNIDEMVAELKNAVNGNKKFKTDKATHAAACKKIANSVNNIMGTVVVPLDSSPEEICNSVGEMINSLTTNIASEFGPMRGDLQRVSKNLGVLEKMVDDNFAAIQSKLATMQGEGAEIDPAVKPLIDFHEKLLEETKRQKAILNALTDTLATKTEADLNEALKNTPDFRKLVSDIKAGPPAGTEGFTKKLSYLMHGFVSAAQAAKVVDDALRQIGVSHSEYKSALKPKDVKDLVNKKLVSLIGKANEKELDQYLKAAKKIISQGYLNKEIGENLGSKKSKEGGNEKTKGGMKLDPEVKKREETRRGLLAVFNQQIASHYNNLATSIQTIAKEIGNKKLELSDDLQLFMNAIETLPDIGKKQVYYSLTGYYDDTESKEQREAFLNGSKNMIATIDELLKNPSFAKISQFKDVQKSLTSINELVNTFYKRFSEGFGPIEARFKGAHEKHARLGADDEDLVNGGELKDDIVYGRPFSVKEINRVSYEFSTANDMLKYNFRVNKMRDSLRKLPAERAAFTKDYTKVVGDAIAKAVDEETAKKNEIDDALKEKGYIYEALKAADAANLNKNLREIKALYDGMYNARVGMYRTAEAIEHYMEAFTNGIAANPDDIQDILHMLNSTEIIANWYSKNAGNEFCHVFDCFPGDNITVTNLHKFEDFGDVKNEHYYEAVNRLCFKGAAVTDKIPGNPLLTRPIQKFEDISAKTVLDHIDNALQVNPLKNIISIFINVGSKFGNTELLSKTHMTATHIYKALLNYIKYSALAVGVPPGEDKAIPGTNPPVNNLGVRHKLLHPITVGYSYQAGMLNTDTFNTLKNPKTATDIEKVMGGVAFNLAGVGEYSRDNPLQRYLYDPCLETDKLFQLTVKSIVSKVFTTIGVYNMLHKPIRKDALGFYNSARVVIGGLDRIPQVIPEALELYVRLPLLTEFYRELFNFEKLPNAGSTTDVNLITMVPEMTGTFSGLISIIFDRAKFVTEGNYSETDTVSIVEEINKIWLKFKGSKNPVNDIIDELIMEVNRRYGILSAEERERYLYERNNRFRDRFGANPTDVEDFPILPDEDEDAPPLPAPSQAYQQTFPGGKKGLKEHKYSLNIDDSSMLLRKLRMKIDAEFAKAGNLGHADSDNAKEALDKVYQSPISFAEILRVRKNELKHASGDKERFQVVMNAINGFGSFATSALDKTYIMFHEMVNYPLTVLRAVYEELRDFRELIEGIHTPLNAEPRGNVNPTNFSSLVERLVSHTGDFGKLVEMQIDVAQTKDKRCDIRINISHSGLIERVKSQLSHVRENVEKFRGLLSKNYLDNAIETNKEGSVGWLEKYLLNNLILGRPVNAPVPDAAETLDPIDKVNQYINAIFQNYLSNNINVNDQLYKLVFLHDGDYAPRAIDSATAQGLHKLLFNNSGKTKSGVANGQAWERINNNIYPYYDPVQFSDFAKNHSLWMNFNRLLAMYLGCVYDNSLQRIYGTTIEKFASGAFSGAIFGNQRYDDFAPFNPGSWVTSSNILFKSLAIIIKQLVSEPSLSGDKKQYFEPDLAEVPIYMKERMKCMLPIFRKMFTLLSQKCETIRKMTQGFANNPDGGDIRTPVINIIDQVETGCSAILVCINETISELNDSAKFMELNEGFIEQYKNANKKFPFMPASSLTKFLKYKNLENDATNARVMAMSDMLPLAQQGTDSFKLLYGSRNIINSNPKIGDFPSSIEIMKMHNSGVSGKSQFTEKDLENTIVGGIDLLNMMINVNTYKKLLTGHNDMLDAIPNLVPADGIKTLQIDNTFNDRRIVLLTESPAQKEQLQLVSRFVQQHEDCAAFKALTREAIRVYNIIDLNKMPINVAALMKEMPLVNLYNYAYSFDNNMMDICDISRAELDVEVTAMANSPFSITLDKLRGRTIQTGVEHTMNGQQANVVRLPKIRDDGRIVNAMDSNKETKRLLGLLLMFPHDEVSSDVYELYIPRIMRGDTAIEGLDRPTFLGEELYNKALFGQLYPNESYYDESGPRVASIHGRPMPATGAPGMIPVGRIETINPADYTYKYPSEHPNGLSYMTKDRVVTVNMGEPNNKALLESIGKIRFDTKLVRNYMWLVNLQRVMRLQMRRDLFWYDSKIVSDHAVLSPAITEITGNKLDSDVRSRTFMN